MGNSDGIGSHFLVRVLFLRSLAFLYSVVFIIAYRQNKALIGDDGITPAREILDAAERRGSLRQIQRQHATHDTKNHNDDDATSTILQRIAQQIKSILQTNHTYRKIREILWDRTDASNRSLPTLLWMLSPTERRSNLNPALDRIALTGITLSLTIGLLGAANLPLLLALYLCQRSLASVGGHWYSYEWEPQLAELTFLTLSPYPPSHSIPSPTTPRYPP